MRTTSAPGRPPDMQAYRRAPARRRGRLHLPRRYWSIAGAILAASILGGYAAAGATDPIYSSKTSVQVDSGEVNLATEAQLVSSTRIREAARLRGAPDNPPTVEVSAGSAVLVIHYEASTPQRAQDGARAYADAYVAVRPGSVLAAANLPPAPVRPDLRLYLGLSGGVGLLLGLAVAVGTHRLSSTVYQGTDITVRAGMALLAQLPPDAAAGGLAGAGEPAGRAFS